MTFRELQHAIDQWISQFEAGYWSPLANLARLTEEVGELAREINHYHGPKTKKSGEDDGSIGEELGDILFTVAAIANSLDIDLEEVVAANLAKVAARDTSRWQKKADSVKSRSVRPVVSGLRPEPQQETEFPAPSSPGNPTDLQEDRNQED